MNNIDCENNLINLFKLKNVNINIYDINNNVKSKNNLLKECKYIKKKELKDIKSSSSKLSNLIKLTGGNINNINDLIIINNQINEKINNINNIDYVIDYIGTIKYNNKKIKENIFSYPYIEYYSN